MEEARLEVAEIDYPVLVRPSFVLGGRAMEIVVSRPVRTIRCGSLCRLRAACPDRQIPRRRHGSRCWSPL